MGCWLEVCFEGFVILFWFLVGFCFCGLPELVLLTDGSLLLFWFRVWVGLMLVGLLGLNCFRCGLFVWFGLCFGVLGLGW